MTATQCGCTCKMSVPAVSGFDVPGLRVCLSVCVWERVVAGSPSCVDVLCLSALVATEGEMYSLCVGLCRGAWLAGTSNKERVVSR